MAHAGFIDLDTSRPLNLEIKLNVQQITNFTPNSFAETQFEHLKNMRSGIEKIGWY